MKRIGYVASKKCGKTDFLLIMINDEYSQGNKCYYLGGQRHYSEIVEKLKKNGSNAKIELITKDVMPSDEHCAVFTDGLTWEMTSIFPYAVRIMTKLSGNWYYTLPREETIILDESDIGGGQNET